jgi:hypothetical protein
MTLNDISTEMLIKLRERFQNGRTRFSAVAASVAWTQDCERKIIETIEGELGRRLNGARIGGARPSEPHADSSFDHRNDKREPITV